MALNLYNTLGREKQEFVPIKAPQVGVYSCGPTVYNYAHIGNLRSYVFADLLNRVLRSKDYQVTHIINITDVGHLVGDGDSGEDKMQAGAKREGKSAKEIADFYTQAFFKDIQKLGLDLDHYQFPKATEHIAEQIALIETLTEKGFTYETSDGLYFDTSLYPKYSELAGLNLAGQEASERTELNLEKRQPSDFALWKFSKPSEKREQEWPSPWGLGFPGWHIECSAMATKYLGEHFDLHTGGIDHIPVHHSNERAQSECASGEPYVNYWLHNNFMTVDGQKMSKSLGNIFRLDDLIAHGHSPLAYRYLLLSAHYRSELNFTWEALAGAETAYRKLINAVKDLKSQSQPGQIDEPYQVKFHSALDNDLNSAQALAVVWELLKDESLEASQKLATILDFDQILGLNLDKLSYPDQVPTEIKILIEQRDQARAANDWTRADNLRQELADLGYDILDTDHGSEARPKNQL